LRTPVGVTHTVKFHSNISGDEITSYVCVATYMAVNISAVDIAVIG